MKLNFKSKSPTFEMMVGSRFLFSLLFSLFTLGYGFCQSQQPGGASYRSFSSKKGTPMRARILSVDQNARLVELRTSAGNRNSVSFDQLSAPDQQYLLNWDPDERWQKLLRRKSRSELFGYFGMASVPFEIENRGLFIPVKLNDTSGSFFIDAGGFLSMVDKVLAKKAGAEFTGTTYADFPLADGSIETVTSALFKTFSVGPITSEKWQMGACDLARTGRPYEGVLGGDYLELNRVIFDWGRNRAFFNLKKKRQYKAPAIETEWRTFTSNSAIEIEAKLSAVTEERVKLLSKDGKEAEIPFSALSNSDREYIDLYQTHPLRQAGNEMLLTDLLHKKGYDSVEYSYGNSTIPAFELTIGGEKLRFLINPSMSFSYLDLATARHLDIPIEDSNDRLKTPSGAIIQLQQASISGLNVASKTLPPLLFRVLDLEQAEANGAVPIKSCMAFRFPELRDRLAKKAQIQGILGRDLLKKMEALIDYDTKRLFVK